jgi:SAM-dependent methyltransferase
MSDPAAATCRQEPALVKQDSYFNLDEQMERYLEHSYQPEVEQMFTEVVQQQGPVRRLLDVGCASGRTSIFTKRLGVEELVGIEIDERAVAAASRFMDRVIQADVSKAELDNAVGYFDMIFMTDILEHLVDPWSTLRRYVAYLRPGGQVLIVLPNFGHIAIVNALLAGLLQYEESGIMDRGHLRIFTLRTALQLIEQAGLTVDKTVYRIDADWNTHRNRDLIPLLDNCAALRLDGARIPQGLKMSYFVRKFHFLCSRTDQPTPVPQAR